MTREVDDGYDTATDAAEAKAALLLRLRSMGVRTVAVLRAMETVPRESFVEPAYAADAQRDIVLPLPCGQSTAEPSFIARQLEALSCTPDSRVLEVGSGSGYVTALLARLAGAVHGVERYRRLADAARDRAAVGRTDVTVAWGDGLEPDDIPGPVDRVLLHVALPAPPAGLLDRLEPGGVMVCAIAAEGRQDLVRLVRDRSGATTAVRIAASRLPLASAGRSRLL